MFKSRMDAFLTKNQWRGKIVKRLSEDSEDNAENIVEEKTSK